MPPVSFKRHRSPPDVIRLAVWLYCRFTLSFRDVEEMRRCHLDEMAAKIRGERKWLWRAVDDEGEVLDMLVQKRRNSCTVAIDIDADACPTTIERRTRIWSFGDASANNRGSNRNVQCNGSSRLTPPSTTSSTFKDT